jgi:Family of unknown function (DUF6183)
MRLLAEVPSADRAAAAIRLGLAGALASRELANLLAMGQKAKVLVRLVGALPRNEQTTELGACVLHGLLAYGKLLPPAAADWVDRLAGHPLGELPLDPLPGEHRQPTPGEQIAHLGTVPVLTSRNVPPGLAEAVTACLDEPEGYARAFLCTLTPPVAPHEVGMRLRHEFYLRGDGLWPAELADVVGALFRTFRRGPYWRLIAWRALNGLAGGPLDDCSWWLLFQTPPWGEPMDDVAVWCLRPGGDTLAGLVVWDLI